MLLRRRSICLWIPTSLSILGWTSLASATGFTGQTLSGAYYLPDTATPYVSAVFSPPSFVVGAGQETSVDVEGVTTLNVDFDADSLTIAFQTTLGSPTWLSTTFNGLIFDSVDPLGITGASVDGSTTMAGFDDSRVTFNANQILINWSGLGYVDGTQVKVHFTGPSYVPEPGTALLLGLGLAALSARRRTPLSRALIGLVSRA